MKLPDVDKLPLNYITKKGNVNLLKSLLHAWIGIHSPSSHDDPWQSGAICPTCWFSKKH